MDKVKWRLKVYAYHAASDTENYLFTFKVGNKREALNMLPRFTRLRSAWLVSYFGHSPIHSFRLK